VTTGAREDAEVWTLSGGVWEPGVEASCGGGRLKTREWKTHHWKRGNIACMGKKGGPYSITERRVPELVPVLCSHPAGDVSHKPGGGRLPLLFAKPAVTPATLKRAATSFAAWWTEAQWV